MSVIPEINEMLHSTTASRLTRIEKILLGMEWGGVEVDGLHTAETYRFCLLCHGYDPSQINQVQPKGHQPGCLFLELPR